MYAHLLLCRVNHDNQSIPFHFDKNNVKIILYIALDKIIYKKGLKYIKIADRNVQKIHILRSYAQFAPGSKFAPGANNLLHLESRCKFATGANS